jgi:hypothetical protein
MTAISRFQEHCGSLPSTKWQTVTLDDCIMSRMVTSAGPTAWKRLDELSAHLLQSDEAGNESPAVIDLPMVLSAIEEAEFLRGSVPRNLIRRAETKIRSGVLTDGGRAVPVIHFREQHEEGKFARDTITFEGRCYIRVVPESGTCTQWRVVSTQESAVDLELIDEFNCVISDYDAHELREGRVSRGVFNSIAECSEHKSLRV